LNFDKNSFLAQQLKDGNFKAYTFLMETYYQKLCGYAYVLTKDHDMAEDIVQEVFTKVWFNKKKINPKFSIKNYLFKSVYNEFIDQHRKNKRVIYLEKKYLESMDLVVEKETEDFDELIKLMNAEIDKLPRKCKEIFLLNKREGLTQMEIAEYLNIAPKTIEGHMTRAFKVLSEKLRNKMDGILFLLFGLSKSSLLRKKL